MLLLWWGGCGGGCGGSVTVNAAGLGSVIEDGAGGEIVTSGGGGHCTGRAGLLTDFLLDFFLSKKARNRFLSRRLCDGVFFLLTGVFG